MRDETLSTDDRSWMVSGHSALSSACENGGEELMSSYHAEIKAGFGKNVAM